MSVVNIDAEVSALLNKARNCLEETGGDKYYINYTELRMLVERGAHIVHSTREGSYIEMSDARGPLRFAHRCTECPHEDQEPTTYYE